MKTTLIILAATAMLSGCGLLQGPAPADPRETLRRADLEAVGNPLLLAVLPEKGVFASLMPLVRKGDTLTWVTADGVTLAFENGVLIGSRGLGDDLMGGDSGGTASAIAGERRVMPGATVTCRATTSGSHCSFNARLPLGRTRRSSSSSTRRPPAGLTSAAAAKI